MMDKDNFDFILNLVAPSISKEDALLRQSISLQEQLQITLRYLAAGYVHCFRGSAMPTADWPNTCAADLRKCENISFISTIVLNWQVNSGSKMLVAENTLNV